MKNKTQIAITLGLMCILLTSAVVVQLNTIKEATKIVGSSYAQAELKEEVLRKKDDYERIYKTLENKEKELEKAREETTQEKGRGAELQKELDEVNRLLGMTEIIGSGIVLTLKDSDPNSAKELGMNISKALVHDEDLRQIINELKNSGAEAISVNGQRIVSTTAIICSGTVVTINGVKMNSPFEIKAIGNISGLSAITRVRRVFVNNGR